MRPLLHYMQACVHFCVRICYSHIFCALLGISCGRVAKVLNKCPRNRPCRPEAAFSEDLTWGTRLWRESSTDPWWELLVRRIMWQTPTVNIYAENTMLAVRT